MHKDILSSVFKRIISYSFLLVGYAGVFVLFLFSYDNIIQGHDLVVNSCAIILSFVIYILVNHLLTSHFVSKITIRTFESVLIAVLCICAILFSNYSVINLALSNCL